MKKIYKAKWMITCASPANKTREDDLSCDILYNSALIVENGEIVGIKKQSELDGIDGNVKDFGNAILTPGFVNLQVDLRHTLFSTSHSESMRASLKRMYYDTKFKALRLEKYPEHFKKWAKIYKEYNSLELKDRRKAVREGLSRLIFSGTTCFSAIIDDDFLFEEVNKAPALKFCFFEISSTIYKKRLQTFKDFAKKLNFHNLHKSNETFIGVAPLPIFLTDKKFWQVLSRFCRMKNLPILTNFMEMPEERAWLGGDDDVGVINKIMDKEELIPFEPNLNPVDYLKDCFNSNLIVCNALELNGNELFQLVERGVKFAYSPRACDKFYKKRHPIELIFATFGQRFGLSTYSLAHNYDLSVLGELKYLNLLSSIDLFEGLRHITLYPAQILNLDDKIGSLEIGKMANFNVFKLNYNENFTSILNKDNPQYVYYRGKMLVGNGNII